MFEHYHRESELRRLASAKGAMPGVGVSLGHEVVQFFKQSVDKRQRKFGKIAKYWELLVPEKLAEQKRGVRRPDARQVDGASRHAAGRERDHERTVRGQERPPQFLEIRGPRSGRARYKIHPRAAAGAPRAPFPRRSPSPSPSERP